MPSHFVKKRKSHPAHLCKAETKFPIVKNITLILNGLIKMEDTRCFMSNLKFTKRRLNL